MSLATRAKCPDGPEEPLLAACGSEACGRKMNLPSLFPKLHSITAAVILHGSLLALYTALSIWLIALRDRSTECMGPSLVWSPASKSIEWIVRQLDGNRSGSIYAGIPRPEADAAWHELLQNMNLRIYPEEMAALGYESLELADGSGYLGTLGVFHELHCLKRIRWWLHREYHYPNATQYDEEQHVGHADHCVELLRQAAICRSNPSVLPFEWADSGDGPAIAAAIISRGSMHQCVSWERLQEWAGARRVDLFDTDLLARPGQ